MSFDRRGFHSFSPRAQAHLESIGSTFLYGYHAALRELRLERLGKLLNAVDAASRGFAFEGAAMALALLDRAAFAKRSRWEQFLANEGAAHSYLLHVGYGWAVARIPWLRRSPLRHLSQFDPLLRWLVVDGFGFHEGYFHWSRHRSSDDVVAVFSGYGRRAFDQGLGRSLWFVFGADVGRVSETIGGFPPERRSDLWSGIGLACAYAGGVEHSDAAALFQFSDQYAPHLAQGAAFAAKARRLAETPADHTQMACEVFCGMTAERAAAVTDECLANLPDDGTQPAYECWRQRIQSRMTENIAIEMNSRQLIH